MFSIMKHKNIFRGLLLSLMMLFASNAFAQVYFTVDGIRYYYYEFSYLSPTLTVAPLESGKYSGDFVIPSSVTYNDKTYRVTSIGESAFSECTSLTSITIPNGVTSIRESAFSKCSSLTSITIPNGVTSIGRAAFSGCSSLTSITIPNGVTSIGISAFSGCSSLTSITIPKNIHDITTGMFNKCSSLTSITIPEGVTSIGIAAFSGCSSLTSITIPNGVTSIGRDAFSDCSSLTEIYCKNPIPCKSSYNFFYFDTYDLATLHVPTGRIAAYQEASIWKNFKNIVEDETCGPCEINDIRYYYELDSSPTAHVFSFDREKNLGDIVIPSSITYNGNTYNVTRITDGAFFRCTSLTSITIPEGVTSIGTSAFEDCTSLTSVTIPESVNSIGERAFRRCSSLKDIYCQNFYPCHLLGSEVFDYSESQTLHVPIGSLYQWDDQWNKFTNIVVYDATTSVNSLSNDADDAKTIYSLDGRRVTKPVPGKIYITNGRKQWISR